MISLKNYDLKTRKEKVEYHINKKMDELSDSYNQKYIYFNKTNDEIIDIILYCILKYEHLEYCSELHNQCSELMNKINQAHEDLEKIEKEYE